MTDASQRDSAESTAPESADLAETPTDRHDAFGQRVRAFRRSRGLTQADLAAGAHLDRKTINRIENSQYSPSLSSVFAIAEALEVEPRDLL
jgi:DNA-binding XRE family transcriptional regulator